MPSPHRARRRLAALAVGTASALLLGACGDDGGAGAGDEPVVVATTSILGDVVSQVAGGAVHVVVLMGRGVDPHEYQASARDAQRLRDADLVVANGGGLEGALHDALDAAEHDGVRVFTALDAADPLPAGADTGDGADGHEHEGGANPHFWQDPHRMAGVVRALGAELGTLDQPDAAALAAGAERYAGELDALDREVAATYAALPEDRRRLVTDHDAFGYLAARYDLTVVGVVIPGGGTEGEPSAADLARLARQVRDLGVPAIFAENTVRSRTADALAREAGGVHVVALFSDALGDDGSGGATYVELVRTNAARITAALG